MLTKKSLKIPHKFCCNICNYHTSSKKDFNKHNNTAKHLKLTNLTKNPITSSTPYMCCICNKEYKSRMGLWQHKQLCQQTLDD